MNISKQQVFSLSKKHLNAAKAEFFLEHGIDFVFGKREGPFVWDSDGKKRLINCHSNGGVFNLGHRNPVLIETLQQALQQVDIGNHHFVSEYRSRLAEQIASTLPKSLCRVIFGVSGGEAIDTALKVARKATGRRGIVSASGGYHGHTGLALAAGDSKYSQPFMSDNPDFVQVPFNNIDALKQAINQNTAAVLLETIPATLGMPLPSESYFQEVAQLCKQQACLLILDEVQTGLGRTGKFWGFEHYFTKGLAPDILVSAKGLSGGLYPITATVIRDDLDQIFHDDPFSHISTFGGAELGCIVASKVIELCRQEGFLNQVNTLAQQFSAGLKSLQKRYPFLLNEIRQQGLMIGLKTAHPDLGKLLMKTCYQSGLLCVYAGNDSSVLQFLPTLTIETALAAEILERLDQALALAETQVKALMMGGKQ